MEIYILRHGEAEPRETNKPDEDRALTAKGKRDVREVVTRAHKAKAAPRLILTSPLRRARETAAVAATVFEGCPVVVTSHLLPSEDTRSIWKEACGNPDVTSVLLVGHEPHLSAVIAYLLDATVSINLKKSALVRIDFATRSVLPTGTLQWMLTPRLARAL